jgi:hypothetical protein
LLADLLDDREEGVRIDGVIGGEGGPLNREQAEQADEITVKAVGGKREGEQGGLGSDGAQDEQGGSLSVVIRHHHDGGNVAVEESGDEKDEGPLQTDDTEVRLQGSLEGCAESIPESREDVC